MSTEQPAVHQKRSIVRRVVRLFLKVLVGILVLLILVIILVQTAWFQNIAKDKAVAYLNGKLKTKVAIGRLRINFPNAVELDNIYVEDRQKDTLLSGGALKVSMDMWKLLHSEIAVGTIDLENITAKIKRQLPDTVFNFQFIADAFASKSPSQPEKKDTGSTKISLDNLVLNKIRLVYNDVVTGNDMEVWIEHNDTRFSQLDLTHMQFGIPSLVLQGVRARIYQNKPIQTPPEHPKTDTVASPSPFALVLRNVDVSDFTLDYKNNVSAMYASVALGQLKGDIKRFDLARQLVLVNSIELNKTTAQVRIGKTVTKETVAAKAAVVIDSADAGWRFQVAKTSFTDDNVRYDDDTKPKQAKGMDFAHLDAKNINIGISDLLYSKDSIAGNITRGSMQEQSGFVLNQFTTQFLYAANQAYLKNLLVKTPGTTIQKSIAVSYPSLEAVQKDMSKLNLDADLSNTDIQLKDVLLFAPSLSSQAAFRNPSTVLHLDARVNGNMKKLNIPHLRFSGIGTTTVDMSGTISNPTDPNKFNADLAVQKVHTTRKDIQELLPPNTLPANIDLPNDITLSGKFRGGMDNLTTDLKLHSSDGDIAIKGTAAQLKNKNSAVYDLQVILNKLNLRALLKDTSLGLVTARFSAKGHGYDPQTANARFNGLVQSLDYQKYHYQNFKLDARVANRVLNATAAMHEPNIGFAMTAQADFASKFPAAKLDLEIDTLFTQPLHLTTDTLSYRGSITADFPVTNPDSLEGKLLVTKSVLVRNRLKIPLDTVAIESGKSDSGQFIRLRSDLAKIALNGKYKLTQLGGVFQQIMEPYFSTVPDSSKVKLDPYDFAINGQVINTPLLKALVPQIDSLSPILLNSHFSSNDGWNAGLKVPLIVDSSFRVDNLQVDATTRDDKLLVNAVVAHVQSGASLNVYTTNISATINDNKIDFSLLNKDKQGKNKYHLAGLVEQPGKGQYALSLKPDSLMLNYDKWTVDASNKILYDGNGVNITKFDLAKAEQQLNISSASPAPDAPIEVSFKDFKLGTLSAFVKPDTLFVDGRLNGKAELNDVMKQPTFTTDLKINDLAFYADTVGDVTLKVNNTQANVFAADVLLNGQGNDVELSGNYNVKPDNNSDFQLTADVRALQLHSIEGATNKAITHASGTVQGKLTITGTLDKPKILGDVNFNKAAFNLTMLNNYLTIENEKIAFSEEGIHFDKFTIQDSTKNKAVIDGYARTADYKHYKFDMTLKANNFHALNTSKKKGALYYGQLYFSTNLGIKGSEASPVIDGNLTINDKTKLTVVLPQREPGIEEREGIVKFVNMNAPPTDFVFEKAEDTLNQSSAVGLDVSVNVEIKKEADFNIVIDEGNGDFLDVRGEASLNAAIDPGGKITLVGTYEIEQGAYELTFNLLKRRFELQKGSKITFKGDATDADVDLTATYIANTAPLDLVKDQLEGSATTIQNTYLQKLPFEVDLKMQGQLLKPTITFDIQLPDNKNYNVSKDIIELVNEKLTEIRKESSELNKQVFALLLLGRFVTENPFESSGPGMSAESIARQSVSKLLTEQLNQLASSLVKGVDLNFDVVSEDDYSTGTRQERTDLNVALSKKLLNDRLTVTIGSNFNLEGAQSSAGQQSTNIAGNIAVDYRLTKDGRYLLRAYRKNDYEGVIDGYVIETGVGFIITVDYNKFREIFQSEKKKQRLRQERQQKRLQKQQQQQQANAPADTKTSGK